MGFMSAIISIRPTRTDNEPAMRNALLRRNPQNQKPVAVIHFLIGAKSFVVIDSVPSNRYCYGVSADRQIKIVLKYKIENLLQHSNIQK